MKALQYAAIVLAVAACSCDRIPAASEWLPQAEYSKFADIPESGIPRNWEYVFCATESDSAALLKGSHNAVVVVRYTYSCPSQSIVLNLEEMSFSHTKPDSLTVRIPLFSKSGKPLGKGTYGIFEISDTIHKDFAVPDGYTVSVSSPVPDEKTVGIKSVGIVINSK